MRQRLTGTILPAALSTWPSPAAALGPMYYLNAFGQRAESIANLTWGLFGLSVFVVLVISVLVLIGILKSRRAGPSAEDVQRTTLTGDGRAMGWIYFGLALTFVALAASVTWTVSTLAGLQEPQEEPRFTVEITGQQWWWEVRYVSDDPSRVFTTANEIHVPVGEPVRVKLTSQDVIHSFWVPAITGKSDLIPGQINVTWLQADRPGVYRGQCAEYCGAQHAHMQLRLFADPPEEFQAWWDRQLQPAPEPQTQAAQVGQNHFILRCGGCHTVRGTRAGGNVGPDLTHLMSRTTIAAGTLPNTVGHLSGWVANPQVIKPESLMPNLELSGPELDVIRAYLLTLE